MKRNKISAVIAIALIILMLVPAMASAATMRHAYGGKIYLRSGPGTEYRSNGTVYNGDHIEVVSYGDIWSCVRKDNGKTGYIKNLYIDDGDMTYAAGTTYVNRYTAYITGNVNFRAGASTSTASMGTLPAGTKVSVLGVNNGFYLISDPNNSQGFVSCSYVSKTAPSTAPSTPSFNTGYTKTVIGKGVNLRAGGGYSYDIICTVPYGAKVSVIYEGSYWSRVNYNGTLGWINNQYLL